MIVNVHLAKISDVLLLRKCRHAPFCEPEVNMAEDSVASSVGKTVGKATVNAFMSPSLAIVKLIPQGIIELVLRGAAVVSY